ncbi:hypothetical protein, partial [Vogesella sp.]|uniref:hypothetical protein n=1 Tax=Vogesella sp. TaxID=1904252 RepID=UPI003F667647
MVHPAQAFHIGSHTVKKDAIEQMAKDHGQRGAITDQSPLWPRPVLGIQVNDKKFFRPQMQGRRQG